MELFAETAEETAAADDPVMPEDPAMVSGVDAVQVHDRVTAEVGEDVAKDSEDEGTVD